MAHQARRHTAQVAKPAAHPGAFDTHVTVPYALPDLPSVGSLEAFTAPAVVEAPHTSFWADPNAWIQQHKASEETYSYLANSVLLFAAIVAALIAAWQAQLARKARLADVLVNLSKSLDELSEYQRNIEDCLAQLHNPSTAQEQAWLLDVLNGTVPYMWRDDVSKSVDTLLSFMEDVGILCRRGYVSKRDVFDIMGGIIRLTIERSLLFIAEQRRLTGRNTYYANALWLYQQARRSRRFGVRGFGTD